MFLPIKEVKSKISGNVIAGTFDEKLLTFFSQVNHPGSNSAGNFRAKAVDEVLAGVQALNSLATSKDTARNIMLFVAAVAARTQRSVLERSAHLTTSNLTSIVQILKLICRNNNEFLDDVWKDVELELFRSTMKKTFSRVKGYTKVFSYNEVEKIKTFINVK
jgi:hypothetical protein